MSYQQETVGVLFIGSPCIPDAFFSSPLRRMTAPLLRLSAQLLIAWHAIAR